MTSLQYPDYFDFDRLLRQHGLALSPAELHGLVSGMLVGGGAMQGEAWLSLLSAYTNEGQPLPQAVQQAVQALVASSGEALFAQQFQYPLLMPSDDENLWQRADALAEWVNHFLSGFGLADVALRQMSPVAKEGLADLEEIAKLGIDEEDDPEEQAMLFEQVIEHVKVCVLSLYAELDGAGQQSLPPTQH